MSGSDGVDRRLDALASLGDPVRRRLYRYVVDGATPVTRDEVAAAIGVSRSTAAYHLDKLADAGLLGVRFERRTGRTGPGAGRPAKLYGRPSLPVSVSLPPREYELLASLLADAVEKDGSGGARDAVQEAARAFGARIAGSPGAPGPTPQASSAVASNLFGTLVKVGYEPFLDDGVIRLRNCPFERVAGEHRELVCRANLALFEGVLGALGEPAERAVLDPGPDRCCVAVHSAT